MFKTLWTKRTHVMSLSNKVGQVWAVERISAYEGGTTSIFIQISHAKDENTSNTHFQLTYVWMIQ